MTASGIARILVIDDEPQIRKFLRISLNAYGYEVIEAVRGEDGIAKCATESPDLVVLDLGLPDLDGQEVIARIREWSTVPIIVLSVRAAENEKVAALDHGADDYVTKPFGIHELLARVRAALRGRRQDGEPPPAVVAVGDLTIDIPRRHVRVAGAEVKLTRKEFAILRLLAQYTGRIVTHQHLLREVWGPAHQHETHYLRIYIGHLRQKLGDDPADPRYISNEPGVGYRLLDGGQLVIKLDLSHRIVGAWHRNVVTLPRTFFNSIILLQIDPAAIVGALPFGRGLPVEQQGRVRLDHRPRSGGQLVLQLIGPPSGIAQNEQAAFGPIAGRHVLEDARRHGERRDVRDHHGVLGVVLGAVQHEGPRWLHRPAVVDPQVDLRLAVGRDAHALEHPIERTGAEQPVDHQPHGAFPVMLHHVHHRLAKVRILELRRRDQQPARERP